MELSDFGKIANNEWDKSFEIRNELFCDEFTIMPNHLHAIIILEQPKMDSDGSDGSDGLDGSRVETHGRASQQSRESRESRDQSCESPISPDQSRESPDQSNFIRKPKSISSFIAGFKSATNSKIDDYIDENKLDIPKYNRNNHFFQVNYNDHIIRNQTEYQRIKNYIINNPKNWIDDKFNKPDNL